MLPKQDQGAMVDVNYNKFWRKVQRFNFEDSLYRLLSTNDCGNEGVPLNHKTLYVNEQGCDYVFSFLNDSFEIGLGYPNKWHTILRRETIHKFIFWYLRHWCFGEWFGLRRYIWFKLLHRKVEGYKRARVA